LITDPAALPSRVTVDVDLVVEAVTCHAYDRLSRAVRARGFHQGTVSDDPICRFRKANIIIDLLPTDPRVLGFGNSHLRVGNQLVGSLGRRRMAQRWD
jgi:hypothetical protein